MSASQVQYSIPSTYIIFSYNIWCQTQYTNSSVHICMCDAEDVFMLLNSHVWELTLNDLGEKPNLT